VSAPAIQADRDVATAIISWVRGYGVTLPNDGHTAIQMVAQHRIDHAASPALYDALEDLFGYASEPLDDRDMSGRAVAWRKARAALVLARGEAA